MMALSMFSATLVPTTLSVAHAREQTQMDLRGNFENVDFQNEIKKFNDYLIHLEVDDISSVSGVEQEAILNNYVNGLQRQRNPISAILGAISGLIAIAKVSYSGGRYIGLQLVSRGWMSKAQYRRNGRPLYWAIVATWGFPVANGLDDYMWGR